MKYNLLMSTALSGVALWALTATGSAADLTNIPAPPPIPAPAPLFTWTGFYVGVNAGGSWGNTGQSLSWLDPGGVLPDLLPGGTPGSTVDSLFPTHFGGDPGGVAGGAQLGYNVQVNNFLFGLEADIDGITDKSGGTFSLNGSFLSSSTTTTFFSETITSTLTIPTTSTTTLTTAITSTITTVTQSTTVIGGTTTIFPTTTLIFPTTTPPVTSTIIGSSTSLSLTISTTGSSVNSFTTSAPFSVSGAGRAKVDWVSTFRTRFGFVSDRALFYITGGLAIGGVSQSTWTTVSIGGSSPSSYTFSGSSNSTRVGGTIGGGIEYALTDNLTIRGQYLYFDLGTSTYGIRQTSGSPTGITGSSHSSELNGSIVTFGINWKFGGP
jgi:opacity protein-like surface antigen